MGKTIRLPGNFYTVSPEKNKTIHVQNKRTGLMVGRGNSQSGDGTKNLRFTKYFDLNKNNRKDDRDIYPGQVAGRLARGESKPSSLEVVPVRKHIRDHTEIRHHFRKIHGKR